MPCAMRRCFPSNCRSRQRKVSNKKVGSIASHYFSACRGIMDFSLSRCRDRKLSPRWGDNFFGCRGCGLPRPFGPRNDSAFLHSAPILVRIVVFRVIARSRPKAATWQSVPLTMRSIVSGHRPDNSISPIKPNLQFISSYDTRLRWKINAVSRGDRH